MRSKLRRNFYICLTVLFSVHVVMCTETSEQRRITNLLGNPKVKRQAPEAGESGKDNFLMPPKISDNNKLSKKLKYKPFVLPEGYNKLQIPSSSFVAASINGFPSAEFGILEEFKKEITVTFRIRDIADVDEHNEMVTFAGDLFVQWTDEVIQLYTQYNLNLTDEYYRPEDTAHFVRTLDPAVLAEIWKPDIFMEDLVKVRHPEIMSQPKTVRLNEVTGEVIYMTRLRIQMECPMDFHYYPADTQACWVVLRSNSYANDELVLKWAEPYGVFLRDCGGPNFDYKIRNMQHVNHAEGYIGDSTREFSLLAFTIVARRKLSYHMVQTYLPSMFFIIITWLCFLVPSRMVEARIGISMTTLLTLTAMFASVRESTPSVSYVRAIDIWMIACVFFVFLTLLEFTVLLWLRREKDELDAEEAEMKEPEIPENSKNEVPTSEKIDVTYRQLRKLRLRRRADMKNNISEFIEKFAFLMFSGIFAVFSVIYWSWLLIGSEYFTWKPNTNINKCEGRF